MVLVSFNYSSCGYILDYRHEKIIRAIHIDFCSDISILKIKINCKIRNKDNFDKLVPIKNMSIVSTYFVCWDKKRKKNINNIKLNKGSTRCMRK